LIFIFLSAIFFTLLNFKLIVFLVSSINIKLVGNWDFWLSLGLRFNGLQVCDINSGLVLHWFFFFHVFLDSSFSIDLIGDWAALFFYLLLVGFSIDFKNDSGYFESFYLSFFVNLSLS
jgi:hypothetical protein